MLAGRFDDGGALEAPAQPETRTQVLVAGTVALCCVAPLLTSLSRSGQAPPEAYLIFERLFFFNDYAGSLAMLVALVLALAVPRVQTATIRLATWVGDHPTATIAAAFITLALCSRFVYMAHPLAMDEYAPWMQANAFAQGSLDAHYPPQLLDAIVPRFFQGYFIAVRHSTGEAASTYWPGLALALTPFAWLHIGWCANPAFGALALAMIYCLTHEACGQRVAAGWAVLAALASPQFTINAISFYAMPGELALNLLFLWLLLKPEARYAFAAGLVGALALAMHNPVPHALMAAPCFVWLAWDRKRWTRIVAAAAGYAPLAILLGPGWLGHIAALQASAAHVATAPAAHGVLDVAASFLRSGFQLPTDDMLVARWYGTWKTWIWACPGLLFVLFIPRARGITERLLLAAFALTYVFFLFVRFDQGHGWGYRYIHPVWGALPVAAGLLLARTSHATRKWGATMVAAGLLATPVFLWQTHGTIAEALSWRLSPPATGEWVVFVRLDTGRYRGDLVQNTPGETRVLNLVSRSESEDRALMAGNFPGAVRIEGDRRGSLWRVPDGMLSERLQMSALRGAGR